jgi:hypothetical protein
MIARFLGALRTWLVCAACCAVAWFCLSVLMQEDGSEYADRARDWSVAGGR